MDGQGQRGSEIATKSREQRRNGQKNGLQLSSGLGECGSSKRH